MSPPVKNKPSGESQPPGGKNIGDILLAHGYVDEEQLERALERAKVTGQPLGQLLVEDGTISRLELATALAEQWSDSPMLPPIQGRDGKGGGAEPDDLDPASYAEMRKALVQLARKLNSTEPMLLNMSERVAEAVGRTELDERVSAVLARIDQTDAAVSELAARLEQLQAE